MHANDGQREARIASWFAKFAEHGSRFKNLARAKELNNVLRPALLSVPIADPDVCIHALHKVWAVISGFVDHEQC